MMRIATIWFERNLEKAGPEMALFFLFEKLDYIL